MMASSTTTMTTSTTPTPTTPTTPLSSLSASEARKQSLIDLAEWKGHRVLAFLNGTYQPGVIRSVTDNRHVGVMFDEGREVLDFLDVILGDKITIIRCVNVVVIVTIL